MESKYLDCTELMPWVTRVIVTHSLTVGSLMSQLIGASLRENLSLGFPMKRDSNQLAKLERLARKSKFRL